MPRSLRGCGGPAEDAGAVCGLVCFSNWFSAAIQQPDKVQDVSAGDRHQDDVATAVSGDDGCAFVGGHSPGVPYTGVSFLDGYVPELGFFAAGRTPQPRADFTMLLTSSGVNIQPRLIEGKRVPNLQNAIIAAAQVCRQSPNADGVPSLACPGNGFEGAEVELEPSAGDRFYAEGGIPQRGLPSITKDSTVTFYDVPRGDYTARILAPPDATSFECSAVHDGTDSMSAWPKQGETNAFEMRVEPGKIHGIFVFCR